MRRTALALAFLACSESNDAATTTADTPIPMDLAGGDDVSSEDDADDPGTDDTGTGTDDTGPVVTDVQDTPDAGPQIPESGPRAYVLSAADTDVIGPGRVSDARPGDIVLRNDVIRLVIRGGDQSIVLKGIGGGAIIDALSDDLPPDADELQEHVPLLSFHGFGKGTLTYENLEGAAEVTFTGAASIPRIIDAYVPGMQVDGAKLTVRYRLEAGSRVVKITAQAQGLGAGQSALLDFPGGGQEVLNDAENGWVMMTGERVGYGIFGAEHYDLAEFGGLNLLFGPTLTESGEGSTWTHYLAVTRGSLSEALDAAWELRLTPRGSVSGTLTGVGPGVTVVARDAADKLVSAFRPAADGSFSGKLPVGLYTLRAEGPGRQPGAPVQADVTVDGAVSGLQLSADAEAALEITVAEATRITIAGGTIPIPPGTTRVPVAPGTHMIYASRGFEYEYDAKEFTLDAGTVIAWEPTVKRVVDTTGWVAADFHLHSEWSTDSSVPLPMRVLACSAEGVEYAVATDHDMVTDYAGALPESLKGRLLVGTGVETSTAQWGHINVWPLEVDKSVSTRGAPEWQGLQFGELMGILAPETPGRIVQINHGRSNSSAQTFTQVGWDPKHRDPALLADMRFNAMEIINDGGTGFDDLMQDWFSFIDEGLQIAATGVSDSHTLGARCGHARTYVEVPTDDPGQLTTSQANQGVLLRRTMPTNGPFITLEPVNATTVHVRIQGPSWMPIETLEIYADGMLDQTIALPPYEGSPVRYDADITLTKPTPRWAVAVAQSAGEAPPVANHRIRGVSPAAYLPK